MRSLWIKTLLYSIAVLVLTTGLGWWFGRPLMGCSLGAIGLIAWLIAQLRGFEQWLGQKEKALPKHVGTWRELYSRLEQVYRRKRKRKRKLSQLLRQYQQAIAVLPDAAIIIDKEDQIVWFNEKAQYLLGLRSDQDIGAPITKLLRHPHFIKFLHSSDSKTVQISAPLNSNISLEFRQVPYNKKQTLLLATDISERQRLEQMRRDFVGNASHELRTPLTVIVGYLETLLDSDPPSHWCQPLRTIAQQSERMMYIVEDLLLLSRLESDTEQMPVKPVDLKILLSIIVEAARVLSADKKHHIELTIVSPSEIMAVEKELHSAFSNLIFNAVRHTSAGSHIDIHWSVDEQGGYLVVSDDGPGIAAHHLARLSERFYRVDRSRQRDQADKGGTGLGLSIVKHVLQRHGARLEIESHVGEGSRFSCYFPASSLCLAAEPSDDTLSAA